MNFPHRTPSIRPHRGQSPRHLVVTALIVLGALAWQYWQQRHLPDVSPLLELYEERQSGEWVEATGLVHKVLGTDDHGDPHQRFIIRLDRDHSVLIAHNVAIADPVPARAGDTIVVRGRYEWNEEGGVVHWTHRDPDGRREGGWIRMGEKTFR